MSPSAAEEERGPVDPTRLPCCKQSRPQELKDAEHQEGLLLTRDSLLDPLTHHRDAALLDRISGNALLQFSSLLPLPDHVFLKIFLMIEIVRQARMYVRQPQRGKTQGNLLGGRPC
jgi:hypothetical protein